MPVILRLKTEMKAAYLVMCHPSCHICVDTLQFDSLCCAAPVVIYKYSANSLSPYLPLLSAPSWIRCPCLETRWNKVGLWSHTQFPSWVRRGWHCAQRKPSHPGSAKVLVKAALTSACTRLCNPGWTGADDPPEEVNEEDHCCVSVLKEHTQGEIGRYYLAQPLHNTEGCFSAIYFFPPRIACMTLKRLLVV